MLDPKLREIAKVAGRGGERLVDVGVRTGVRARVRLGGRRKELGLVALAAFMCGAFLGLQGCRKPEDDNLDERLEEAAEKVDEAARDAGDKLDDHP